MKHYLILLLLELCGTALIFSQSTLLEFIIEEDDNPQAQIIYKDKGCTPDDGVIVFYTAIPNLNFRMPDTPRRLKNVSAFDPVNNCYILCIQPTDTEIGGIAHYSIAITATGYKPMPAFMVSNVNARIAQYFNIKQKMDKNPTPPSSPVPLRPRDPIVRSVVNFINQAVAEKANRYKTDEERFVNMKSRSSKRDLKNLIDFSAKQVYNAPHWDDKDIAFFCKCKDRGGNEPLFLFFNGTLVGVGTAKKGFSAVMADNELYGTLSVWTFSKKIFTTSVNFSTKQKYTFDWNGKVLVMLNN